MLSPARLADIAATIDARDVGSKPDSLWTLYENYLPPFRDQAIKLLELGIHKGVSAKVLSRYFSNGVIVALDLTPPPFDQLDFPNLHMLACDQRDHARLTDICDQFAPDGFDIIIDDASHVGTYSFASYHALFPRLRAGGLYFIEDWHTAYWPREKWGDGAQRRPVEFSGHNGMWHTRIKSHDYGMVGFIKALIDDMPRGAPKVIDKMTITEWFVVLEKA